MKKLSILFTTLAICLGTTAWGDDGQYCYSAPSTCSTLPAGSSCTTARCTTATTNYNNAIWGATNSNGVQSKSASGQLTGTSCMGSYYTCTWGTKTFYRCGPGYYGNPISSLSTCTSCGNATYNNKPLYTSTNYTTIAKRTSEAGSTLATACKMPSGTLYGYDDTGYYTYNSGTVTYTSCKSGYELTLGLCTEITYDIEYAKHSSSSSACVMPSDLEPDSVRALDLATPIPLPTTVNSSGCTFGGWYTTQSGSTTVDEIDILTTFSNGKATFYGKLTANTYTITLNDNGGSGGSGTIKEVYGTKWTNSSGTTITSITIPTRSSYNFNGYWSATSGGTQYIGSNGVLPSNTKLFTSNTTLYAQWTQETAYTITYSKQSGAPSSCSVSGLSPTSYTASSLPVTLPTPATCSGYTFNGWYTTSTGSTKATSISTGTTGNKTYYANWTADETEPTTGTCPAGEFYSSVFESCQECYEGYYCPGVEEYTVGGDTQGLESCGYSTIRKTATCPDNAHDCYYNCDSGTSPAGSNSKSDCYSCSSGCNCGTTLYFTCDDGYVKSGNTCVAANRITTCAAGTYYYKGATTDANCGTCPKGYYCPGVSQFSAIIGSFGNYPCPAGKYNPTTGATSVDACIDCNGTYYTDDIFFEGAYSNCRGAPAQGCCAYCTTPYGTSNTISKTCTQIQTGKECVPGTFLKYGTMPVCAPCPVGYYCPGGVLRYKDMNERYYDATSQLEVFGTGAFRCPTSGGFVAQTTFNQATNTPAAITDCFIPAGYSESDDTGNWEYGQACYYTE